MSRRHPNCTEGASLARNVRGPDAGKPDADAPLRARSSDALVAKAAAFGQWPMVIDGEARMGYNVYTRLPTSVDSGRSWVRYTEWVRYNDTGPVHGPIWQQPPINELYNRSADPNENVNLAGLASMQRVVGVLSTQLHAGWRAQSASPL